jgi:cell division protein FtsX
VLAVIGIVVGFIAFVVPGIFALRSYRRWQDGVSPEPTFAWSITALALATPVIVAAFLALPSIGILVACVAIPSALWLVRPTN